MHRWLRKLGRLRGECKRGLAQRRPAFETLEDRCLLAGNFTEFLIPTAAPESPFGITTGPDGNLWFTNASLNQIGQITTKGVVSATPLSTTGFPLGLITGPGGNIWFTNPGDNSIETLQGGSAVEFSIPSGSSQPTRLTVGADNNLWFAESGSNKIGRVDPATGAITEFALLTPGSGPFAITSGPDGAL